MAFTPAALHHTLPPSGASQRLWVALSGGLDSIVLLHALAQLKLSVPILALHVNHQISAHANRWQQHCADMCAIRGIEFFYETVSVKPDGRGLEDAARTARYAVFERHVQTGDVLLTAHHADDQAETLLLRLLRGSGPRGLAAMARTRTLGQGTLLRPLLDFTRAELESYALAEGLQWIDDESNTDTHYDRNYLRQAIMPLLRDRWPGYTRRWQQAAQACADSEQLLEELAVEDLLRAAPRQERLGWSLSLPVLTQLSSARRHNLLRYWLRQLYYAVPEAIHLQQVNTQLILGRTDNEGEVRWGDVVLHRFRDRLYAMPGAALHALQPAAVSGPLMLNSETQQMVLSAGASLVCEYCPTVTQPGYLRADITQVAIHYRTGGERCQPQGRHHSQTLKKLLQEYGLEPWWREHLPLVYVEDQLAAVGDLWVCEGFAAPPGTAGYRLRWRFQ